MGTMVVLAAFVLAASANPVANSYASSQDTSGTHADYVSLSHGDSEVVTEDENVNHDGETEITDDLSHGSGDDSAHLSTGEESTSLNDTTSTTPTKGDTPIPTEVEATTLVVANSTTSANEEAPTSSPSTASTTSTKPDVKVEESTTEPSGPPPDGDPDDCNIKDGNQHVYKNCSFICQEDMAEVAEDGKPCYLYNTNPTNPLPQAQEGPFVASKFQERTGEVPRGICNGGYCVARNHTDSSIPEAQT